MAFCCKICNVENANYAVSLSGFFAAMQPNYSALSDYNITGHLHKNMQIGQDLSCCTA
jgi:hypothetical protein